ncbi:peptidase [Xanthomonas sp. 3075]|uniref:peptidase n=1 Tax=Xanthomonas sp. 3075 TaxID=3035315 RepID=UPI00160CE5FE|nr:peptidase [Xanthomonas sp. 3075]MBB4133425.1 hypothetical protein [Xanthomonas sp. 3075]
MRIVIAFALAVCVFVPFEVSAQMSGENSDTREAKSYARSALISEKEAARRLKLQAASEESINHIVESYKGKLAAAYWEDIPDLRFIIKLKGKSPALTRKVSTVMGDVPIVILGGADKTLEELEGIISANRSELYRDIPGLEGISIDEKTGQIILYIFNPAIEKNAYEKETPLLEKRLNNSVKIVYLRGKMQLTANETVRGGAILENINRCTGEFIVKHANLGKVGILTAGHCPNNLVYYNWQAYDSEKQVTAALKLEDELWDAKHDLQWHSFPSVGYEALGEIYASSTDEGSAAIILTSSTPREPLNNAPQIRDTTRLMLRSDPCN